MTDRENERRELEDLSRDYRQAPAKTVGIVHRHDTILPVPSAIAGITVGLGLNALLPGGGASHNLTVLLGGVSAFALSLFVNKALFHTGSKLAASGDRITVFLASIWFTAMASVFGTISFTGVTHDMNEAADLRGEITHIATASRVANETALSANRLSPLISGSAADIRAISNCEKRVGCASGQSGPGPLAATLDALADKLDANGRLYANGERKRKALAAELEGLASQYEARLSSHGVSAANRAALLKIYDRAQAIATELGNVVPTAAARALAGDLKRIQVGPARPGLIDVAARLRSHATEIEKALQDVPTNQIVLPPFAPPSGIARGWERLSDTWPLAVFLFGVEGLVIMLWVLQVRDLRARMIAIGLRNDDPDPEPGTNGGFGSPGPKPAPAGRRPSQDSDQTRLIGRKFGGA